MNFLIDIGHPGHVHLYKNLYYELKNKGHEVWVTVKDIPDAVKLLDQYKISYIKFGKKGNGIFAKALKQLLFNIKIFKLVRQKRINVGLGTSISIAHVSRFSRMTSVVFDDDDDQVQPLFTYFAHPFCHFVVSPDALKGKRRKKETIYYPGYHELAYLHPKRFTPDETVLSEA
jgi:predicted glycosyltransferase